MPRDNPITATISFPAMAKALVKYGHCDVKGLGCFYIEDGELKFNATESLETLFEEVRSEIASDKYGTYL